MTGKQKYRRQDFLRRFNSAFTLLQWLSESDESEADEIKWIRDALANLKVAKVAVGRKQCRPQQ